MVVVRDRRTGALVPEQQFGARSLEVLYRSRVGRLLQPLVTRPWFSELAALMRRTHRSASTIDEFVQRYDIDLDDFARPPGGWTSFADFFVRDFAVGAREVPDDETLLLSPADAKLLVVPLDGTGLTVKGLDYSLADLVGDADTAHEFAGGTAWVYRLTVDDAHRLVHPASGRLIDARSCRRLLHTVGPAGTARFLITNSRRWQLWRTDRFGDLLLVAVGALLVGRITLLDHSPVTAGDEAGRFELGGSTLVVLTRAGRVVVDPDLLEASAAGIETRVLAREPVGRQAIVPSGSGTT